NQDWRWSFWMTTILLGICFLWLLPLPETHQPEMQHKTMNQELRGRSTWSVLIRTGLWRPIHMLFVERVVFPCGILVAVTQTVLYVLYVAIPLQFQRVYNFSDYHVGL